jgi:hypothetical protein
MQHAELAALEEGLESIRSAPSDVGRVELIVRRPASGEREVLAEGRLDPVEGLVGDNWRVRGSRATEDGAAHPDLQLTLMNARVAALVARTPDRWALAGDQIYVDFDLSCESLPPGSQVEIGSAVIEVTAAPHTGCGKFIKRFGVDAMKFVNSDTGRELNLRGINTRVISAGSVRRGDTIRRRDA